MNLSIRATSSIKFRFFPSPRTKPPRRCRETFDDGSESELSWRGLHPLAPNTGHHHAPLMLPITRIALASVPTQSYGTAMTTVQAFYAALSAGNGEEAAKFVIPKKRSSGPLSATAISKFYGNLPEPLTLVDVVATRSGEYRVRYRYVASGPRRCDGESIVRTTQVSGSNLIESINAPAAWLVLRLATANLSLTGWTCPYWFCRQASDRGLIAQK
jgi:hypothetical protein